MEWNDVKTELPPYNKDVLIFGKRNRVYWCDEDIISVGSRCHTDWSGEHWSVKGYTDMIKVLNWIELPEKPGK